MDQKILQADLDTLLKPVKSLLAVFAHPDDESFLCGGLLYLATKRGIKVTLLTLTKGEASRERERLGLTAQQMAEVRAKELKAACAALGITSHEQYALPDKAVTPDAAFPIIKLALQKYQPSDVLTFAPHGISGHEDHKEVSEVTAHATETAPSVHRIWYGTIPLSRIPYNQQHGVFYGDHDDEIIRVDVSAARQQKREAIASHQSQQFTLARMQDSILDDLLREECYIIHELHPTK